MPQQCLVRGLNRILARIFRYVCREEALLDEVLDQGSRFWQESLTVGLRDDAKRPFWVDARQPRNKASAKQRKPSTAIFGDRSIPIGALEDVFNCRLDRTLHTSKLRIMREPERAAGMILCIETPDCEGEQWQGILCATSVNVGEKRIYQTSLDRKRASSSLQPLRRPLDRLQQSDPLGRGGKLISSSTHSFQFL